MSDAVTSPFPLLEKPAPGSDCGSSVIKTIADGDQEPDEPFAKPAGPETNHKLEEIYQELRRIRQNTAEKIKLPAGRPEVIRDDVHTVAQRILTNLSFGRAGGEVPSSKSARKDVEIAYALAEAFCQERDRQIAESNRF